MPRVNAPKRKAPAMNTQSLHRTLSAQEYAALIDAAKLRAVQLRREAIDEFWSGAARGLRTAWRGVLRAVQAQRPSRRANA